MTQAELKEFLDIKVEEYNRPHFLTSDPIQIPHLFSLKEDIEISAFLTATIAWGNRKSIIKNATYLMSLLDHAPYEFVTQHSEKDVDALAPFVHRTFNGIDLTYFIRSLQNMYRHHNGLEHAFSSATGTFNQSTISQFKELFFSLDDYPLRTTKHISDPNRGSAAKRINMFLRWMVRSNATGVDFGLWKSIQPSELSCPLDVHSGNVARKLGLLKRKQNDSKALAELDASLRKLDPTDPVKYDFALFGLGVFEKF